jgi:hypothetical protein
MRNYRMRIAALLLVLAATACSSRISPENYEKIENGMSNEAVNDILGEPTETSSFGIGGLSATTAKWVGKTHTITVIFGNGEVKTKTLTSNSGEAKN